MTNLFDLLDNISTAEGIRALMEVFTRIDITPEPQEYDEQLEWYAGYTDTEHDVEDIDDRPDPPFAYSRSR
jgi:hypothetical protein